MSKIAETAYNTSVDIAMQRGAFPLFDRDKYLHSEGFAGSRLPAYLQERIYKHGIANSHLLSVAPAGTISIVADNVSSGIEPVFLHRYGRTIMDFEGSRQEIVEDYGVRVFGVKGRTTEETTVEQHIKVLGMTAQWVDSAVSKTVNVPENYSFEEFKEVYELARRAGAKGCTTFRTGGALQGILNKVEDDQHEKPVEACYVDPVTGRRECA